MHLSLSCTKIERLSPLEKSSCKVRLFVQNRSRKYRPKVTVTTLFQTAFQLLSQTAHVCFHGRKRARTRLRQQDRTQGHTRRNRGPSLLRSQLGFVLPVKSILFRHAFIYIHFPVLCGPPPSATAPSQAIFHRVFQPLAQMAHVRFHE